MSAINTRNRAAEQGLIATFGQVILFALSIVAFSTGSLSAHELNPAIANIELDDSGGVRLKMTVNLEALIAEIGPGHDNTETAPQAARYDALRALPSDALTVEFDAFERRYLDGIKLDVGAGALELNRVSLTIPEAGDTGVVRRSVIGYEGQLPPDAKALTWHYAEDFGQVVLRVAHRGEDAPFFANLLAPGATETIELAHGTGSAPTGQTLLRYIKLGFDHILPKGLDHVLFIIGLFLLSARMKPLLLQVTTFTLAHSVTLALGLMEWVRVPGAVVEPLIALSIVFVAVENIFSRDLHRWRMAIVFGFGLLHGLGFAAVLRELSVAGGQFATSLIGFNIGVELGQIVVVLLCYAAVGYWFGTRVWYHARVVTPASVIIACLAGYWFFERLGFIA